MIKLTTNHGTDQWINPDHITDINHDGNGSCIYRINDVSGDYPPMTVKESPEEVVRKIMEYKMSLARYTAGAIAGNKDMGTISHDYLIRLAGLEQTP